MFGPGDREPVPLREWDFRQRQAARARQSGMARRRRTAKRDRLWRAEYLAGRTLREIAAAAGVSHSTVQRGIDRVDISDAWGGDPPPELAGL